MGLVAIESRDLGKVSRDLLNRVLKYYSILIPLPTFAGYPIALFPSDKHLGRFMEIEIPAIRSYASIYLSGIYRPIRIRNDVYRISTEMYIQSTKSCREDDNIC